MTFQHNLDSDYISIYVHWPYCVAKCPYCDFNSHKIEAVNEADWINAYKNEFDYFKDILQGKYVRSIFFGGGTPSLMPISILAAILHKISQLSTIDSNTEITLEANPNSVEQDKFQDIAKLGINRVSIGVQSFNDLSLKFLGRAHNSGEASRAIETAKKYFNRTSFDLIYALPGQSLEDWRKELNSALQYIDEHVSLYQLTIEKGTEFYKDYVSNKFALPDQAISEDMYILTDDVLRNHNIEKYEISNYAMPNKECRHNLAYWNYDNYLGIGPGAHSRLSFANSETYAIMMKNSPNQWLKSNLDSEHSIQNSSLLTKEEILTEILMMGLRLKKGINTQRIESLVGSDWRAMIDPKALKMFHGLGYIDSIDNEMKLSDRGLILHNYIVPRLIL